MVQWTPLIFDLFPFACLIFFQPSEDFEIYGTQIVVFRLLVSAQDAINCAIIDEPSLVVVRLLFRLLLLCSLFGLSLVNQSIDRSALRCRTMTCRRWHRHFLIQHGLHSCLWSRWFRRPLVSVRSKKSTWRLMKDVRCQLIVCRR